MDSGELFEAWLEWVKHRVRQDHDYCICIEGHEGSGKSTFGINLGIALDERFDIENMVYDYWEMRKKIYSLPKYSVICCDESIFSFFKRDAMGGENKDAVKLLNVIRYRNQILIFIIPHITELESYLSNHRVNIVFECREDKYGNRGIVTAKIPHRQPWLRKTNWYPKYSFKFADLPPEWKIKYLTHKEKNTLEKTFRDETFEKPDTSRKEIYLNSKEKLKLSDKDIAEKIFQVDRRTLYNWRKSWKV